MYRLQELRTSEHPLCLQATIASTCLDKNTVWVHHTTSALDFLSIVLIRTLPGALRSVILPWHHPVLSKNAWWCLLLWVLPLNWIRSNIISGASFSIIGLTTIPIIKYFPLDWIYRSIRIMMVPFQSRGLIQAHFNKKTLHTPTLSWHNVKTCTVRV